MSKREQSSIGAAQYYGPRKTNEGLPNTVATYGLVSQVEVYFDYEQANAGLPSTNAQEDVGGVTSTLDAATLIIPAGSLIKDAYLQVGDEDFLGTGSVQVGLELTDGTTLAPAGLFDEATEGLEANAWVVGDRSAISASVGTADVQISVASTSGALTAGKGRVVIEYIAAYGK